MLNQSIRDFSALGNAQVKWPLLFKSNVFGVGFKHCIPCAAGGNCKMRKLCCDIYQAIDKNNREISLYSHPIVRKSLNGSAIIAAQ